MPGGYASASGPSIPASRLRRLRSMMSETPHPSLPPTLCVLCCGLVVGRGSIKVEFHYPKPTLPARRRQAGALLGECRRSGRSLKVGITNRGEFVEGGSLGGLGPIVNRLRFGVLCNATHCVCAFCIESLRLTLWQVFAVENNSKSTKGGCVPGSYLGNLTKPHKMLYSKT